MSLAAQSDIEALKPDVLAAYSRLCGGTLARAHARAGNGMAIGAYLGGGSSFDKAVARFASSYADQNERDHRALVDAIADGRVKAQTGL